MTPPESTGLAASLSGCGPEMGGFEQEGARPGGRKRGSASVGMLCPLSVQDLWVQGRAAAQGVRNGEGKFCLLYFGSALGQGFISEKGMKLSQKSVRNPSPDLDILLGLVGSLAVTANVRSL